MRKLRPEIKLLTTQSMYAMPHQSDHNDQGPSGVWSTLTVPSLHMHPREPLLEYGRDMQI